MVYIITRSRINQPLYPMLQHVKRLATPNLMQKKLSQIIQTGELVSKTVLFLAKYTIFIDFKLLL